MRKMHKNMQCKKNMFDTNGHRVDLLCSLFPRDVIIFIFNFDVKAYIVHLNLRKN